MFFVISGYLITSILLAALAGGTLSLAGFWSRRVRRLFPALSALLRAANSRGSHRTPPHPVGDPWGPLQIGKVL